MKTENKNKSEDQNGNGLRDHSHLPRAKDFKPSPMENLPPEMQEYVIAGREAVKAIAEAVEKGELPLLDKQVGIYFVT